ncbi:MAG: DUF177 domain-containing protein [Rhodospirillaceae bacterium]
MNAPQSEFSFPVDATTLPPSGRHYEITADEAERARVAQRLGLPAISALKARFDLTPRAGGIVKVTGSVQASVTQTCVVTLVPVPAEVREDIEARFTLYSPVKPSPKAPTKSGGKPERDEEEDLLDFGGEEPAEEAIGGQIDLGELAVVQLALGLDPYPRAPGAAFDAAVWGEKDEKTVAESPFAVLAKLKAKSPPTRGN